MLSRSPPLFRIWLPIWLAIACVSLISIYALTPTGSVGSMIIGEVIAPEPVHIKSGQDVTVSDPRKTYIAEAGSHVIAQGVYLRALAGSVVEGKDLDSVIAAGSFAEGQGARTVITGEAGAKVTAYGGVLVIAHGAEVTVYGNPRVSADTGAVIYNYGRNSVIYANAGAVVHSKAESSKIYAKSGSVVDARTECDDCTIVEAYQGATVCAYKGIEVMSYGAIVSVFAGGEVHANLHSTVFWYPDAEGHLDPDTQVILMPGAEAPPNARIAFARADACQP